LRLECFFENKTLVYILVINIGSSSLKYGLLELPAARVIVESDQPLRGKSVTQAIREIPAVLAAAAAPAPSAIGHRVVHGGERFTGPARLDDGVIAQIDALAPLAPLHNINALEGIRAARSCWPGVSQVAVFDTSFHATMPDQAKLYAVPEEWRKAGVRRYGFHGISHQAMLGRIEVATKRPASELRIVSFHLGNGASGCAIHYGRSIDTSMGMTPLEGLVMGTRSGDVDPGLHAHLERTLGLSAAQVEDFLYRRSGLAALSGIGHDMREIEAAARDGNVRAQQALDVFCYRARKLVGAYAAAMGGLDVISFTGGIGENSAGIRASICADLGFLGVALDPARNDALRLRGLDAESIETPHSRVKIVVARAGEQEAIARSVFELTGSQDHSIGKQRTT
jgi:acetate kinase